MRAPTRDDKRQHRFGGGVVKERGERERVKVLFKGGGGSDAVGEACVHVGKAS